MAVLPIVKFGDLLLRRRTAPVTDFEAVRDLVDDMFETMYEEAGMGLAANQVGLHQRFAVIDISHEEEDDFPRVFVNPEIVDASGSYEMEEGCLSIPEIRATITRPDQVRVRYQDENGLDREDRLLGLLGRVIQHEMDHLNGVFFIDHLTPAKRAMIKRRLMEIAETGAPSTGITL